MNNDAAGDRLSPAASRHRPGSVRLGWVVSSRWAMGLAKAVHEHGDSWTSDYSAAWRELIQQGVEIQKRSYAGAGDGSAEDESARVRVIKS